MTGWFLRLLLCLSVHGFWGDVKCCMEWQRHLGVWPVLAICAHAFLCGADPRHLDGHSILGQVDRGPLPFPHSTMSWLAIGPSRVEGKGLQTGLAWGLTACEELLKEDGGMSFHLGLCGDLRPLTQVGPPAPLEEARRPQKGWGSMKFLSSQMETHMSKSCS